MKLTKILGIAFISCTVLSTNILAKENKLNTMKKIIIKNQKEMIFLMKENISCVEGSKNLNDLENCRNDFKSKMLAKRPKMLEKKAKK